MPRLNSLIVFVVAGIAGMAATSEFEVAAIKPCSQSGGNDSGGRGGGGSRGLSTSPGRLAITCMTVADLINVAYVQYGNDSPLANDGGGPFDARRLKGGPAWAYSSRYSIEAKADGIPGPQTMQGPMLRAMLEERFRLKTHREVEEVPMYALTVAKGGLKLKPLQEGCTQYVIGMAYADPSLAPDGKPWCVNRSRSSGLDWMIESAGQDTGGIAKMLSQALDRHVIDKTGITGLFSFHLEFAKDENAPGRGGAPSAPSVFTAVEQQLGLKLVPDKGPHGVIVIDSVDRPSDN
jgi:uncharacterized protein (TIGR03435 family)